MPEYTPPTGLHADLNFKDELKPASSHRLVLNFGAADFAYARIKLRTRLRISAQSTNERPADSRGTARIKVKTSIKIQITSSFDINHVLGVALGLNNRFRQAAACLGIIKTPWSKSTLRVSNEALFLGSGLLIATSPAIKFDQANLLFASVRFAHEQATGLSAQLNLDWGENKRLRVTQSSVFEQAEKLHIQRAFDWVELVRKRKQFTYSHEVAQVFEKQFSFEWDEGLEFITASDIAWEKAKAIHYRKHPVQPWPQPEIPEYIGSTDLNFICLCHEMDSHNIVLNFGSDECIPAIPNKNWWHIMNNLSVTRLDNGEEIRALDGNYSTDRNSWCWSYSLTVPASEIVKLSSIDGQPVILRIMVNGNEHHMLLESRTRSRKFAQDAFNLTGRSQSALLDAPYAPTRSFLQENERTARQLCQAELDRVNSPIRLNWQLIDELSWILPVNSLSYSNLTPIAVIKMIAESAGGFVYSEKSGQVLTVKPKYKKTFWDSIAVNDYDRLIPLSITMSQTIDDALFPDYNGITLTNDRTGLTGQVKRTGTSADVLQETVNNPLFTLESMGGYGKSVLAKAGMVESHTLSMPVGSDVGECEPGELTAFDAEWWGISDSVAVSFTHAIVNQTVKVERVNHG
ncbi:hypothetical protein EXE25_17685 [Acinetobacter bouvetii]|uniref:Uncharacterized protein n=1 Tax=Acinetobacter bouvetii TaxID=202951 RepID=A0A4Q7AQP1_9GAMM|nr:hypothetical protein [Acinetobacter bouvetii]RZG64070.1 hypothetical protein EXE25_17685 [Acinetobacter bouvetii]